MDQLVITFVQYCGADYVGSNPEDSGQTWHKRGPFAVMNATVITASDPLYPNGIEERLGETLPIAAVGNLDLLQSRPLALFCGGGTRSRIGVSVLRRAGFTKLFDQGGGFPAHAEAGLPVE